LSSPLTSIIPPAPKKKPPLKGGINILGIPPFAPAPAYAVNIIVLGKLTNEFSPDSAGIGGSIPIGRSPPFPPSPT
jgi:hypothetical protein